jgi:hypothetical protein
MKPVIWRRAAVLLVLCWCPLLLACAVPAGASARVSGPRVRVSFTAVGGEVDAGGLVAGRSRARWRAVLQQRLGSRWLVRASGGLRVRGGASGFSLAWHGVASGHRETVRVEIVSGRRVIAKSVARSVASSSPVSVKSVMRPSTVQPSPGRVLSVSGSPGGSTVVVLGPGARVPAVGAALVMDASAKAPDGLLGVVRSAARAPDGSTNVTTTPGTLEDAYSSFEAHLNGTLGQLAGEEATAAGNRSSAHSAVNLGVFKTAFGCDDSSTQKTITHTIDLSELEVHAEVTIPSWGNGYSGPGVLFTIGGQPKLGLGVKFSGETTCHAQATAKIPIPDTPDLDIEIGPDFTLHASGAVGVELEWEPRFFYGFSRFRGEPSNDWKSFHNGGHTNFTGDASLTLSLALESGLSLAGRVGVRGALGPEITGQVTAQTSPPQACLSVNADFAASLTAFASTFFHDYTFTIASAKFGNLQLYHGCTSSTPAPAPTRPAPTPPPSPAAPTVPAVGPTLVYDGQTAIPPEEESFEFEGDRSFNEWSEATGQTAVVNEVLPANITPDRCVVLLTNESLDEGQEAELAAYVRAGGTILALGEHEGGDYATADETLSRFAASLGVGLALNDDSHDSGPSTTYEIEPSPLTENVFSLGDNWVSTLEVSGAAQSLVGTADGEGTLVGTQTVGAGTFVMAGDSNIFTDDSQGYDEDDNGQFAHDLCP